MQMQRIFFSVFAFRCVRVRPPPRLSSAALVTTDSAMLIIELGINLDSSLRTGERVQDKVMVKGC